MYIEFALPTGAAGAAAGYANFVIETALKQWGKKHQIAYISKVIKFTKRVTFDQDQDYTVFALTWNSGKTHQYLSRWHIVSDLNNKIKFDFVL